MRHPRRRSTLSLFLLFALVGPLLGAPAPAGAQASPVKVAITPEAAAAGTTMTVTADLRQLLPLASFDSTEVTFTAMGPWVLDEPVVGMATTPDLQGYWVVTPTGRVHAFGNAPFKGDVSAIRIAHPIVGMAASPSGQGYWLLQDDGGIYSFGDAPYAGSPTPLSPPAPAMGIVTRPGAGYRVFLEDGTVYTFDGTGPGTATPPPAEGFFVDMVATLRGRVLAPDDGG